MEEDLASLNLIDEEEDAFQEDAVVVDQNYHLSLVGRCLTDSVDLVGGKSVVSFVKSIGILGSNSCSPPGLMTESMAKQFGDFLGQFLDYDTSFLSMGFQNFMHIRVRLDVTIPLKRKKKILIGKDRIVYAQFQYEKLSLFCFICGKLGHEESFYPFRTRIEPSKIVFGFDISLLVALQ
ncbi:hypothetical protein Goari_017764 [Gossypium aridum]|uniref:Zinc knuckle CX2CX4HX4C domain-containing protein n=1 Tax=Gossypium aridum TaxID=34290 RepID=A0A7J8WN01_GOSAI|nr:hypothetical protein [Gossypium aridum]